MTHPSRQEPALATPPIGAMLGSDVAQMFDLMDCGLQAWSAYWTAWLNARSPADMLQASTALAAEGFSLSALAAARRQRFHGRLTPTLNEA